MTSSALPTGFALEGDELRLDPREPAFFEDPYPTYAALHASGRGTAVWRENKLRVAWRQETVSKLLRDRRFGRILPADTLGRADHSAQPPHVSAFYALEANSLLELEPPTHTRLRSLVTKAFVSRRVEAMEGAIRTIADDLIDAFAAAGEADLVATFAEQLPVRVIARLIGVGEADSERLLAWSHAMVAMYRFGRTRSDEDAAEAAARDFSAYLRDAIEEKRRRPAADLVSTLIAAESEDGRLSADEMVSTLVLLLNAGHEATVHAIGNAVAAILSHDIDAGVLLAEDSSADRLVEEALRFDTPLHLFRRTALEEVEVEGGTLARGEEIALLLGAANRDPTVFAQPQRFDPARAPNPHVSFGGGIHFCVGAPLARLEMRAALRRLFERLPGLALAGTLSVRDTWHFRGLDRLDVRFDPVRS